jgi:hypothetical protein
MDRGRKTANDVSPILPDFAEPLMASTRRAMSREKVGLAHAQGQPLGLSLAAGDSGATPDGYSGLPVV